MSEVYISESDMQFGPFEGDHIFNLEKSSLYKEISDGIKIAEFVIYRNQGTSKSLWIIEAKSSGPNSANPKDFDYFVASIAEKLHNSFLLIVSMILKRHPHFSEDISDTFKSINLSVTDFKFILVVKSHQNEWLPPLNDRIKTELKKVTKIWPLLPTAIATLNEDGARRRKLIK